MMFSNDDSNKIFNELVENTNLANNYLVPVLDKLKPESLELGIMDIAQIAKSVEHLIISNARTQALLLMLASEVKSLK